MERLYQRLTELAVSVQTRFNELCRDKLQTAEKLEEIDRNIQYARGSLDTCNQLGDFIKDIHKQDEIENRFKASIKAAEEKSESAEVKQC
ncbi:MAG: hypothetical protein PHU70_02065 [Dehalococcoidia bacterium]|nr:hypothetical protein [Dehalococcoidia bacterium]